MIIRAPAIKTLAKALRVPRFLNTPNINGTE